MEKTTIDRIFELIKEEYGECTTVEILVDSGGISLKTVERANLSNYSMKNINGDWIRKK